MQISSHLPHRTRFRFSPWVMAELRPRTLRLSPASRDGDTTPEHGALGRLCWKRRVGREVWGKGGGEGKTHPDTAGRSLQRPGPAFGAGRRRGGTGRGLPSAGPGGARQGGGFSFVSGCAAGDGTGRNKHNRPAPGWRRDSRACGASRLRPRARAVRRGQRRGEAVTAARCRVQHVHRRLLAVFVLLLVWGQTEWLCVGPASCEVVAGFLVSGSRPPVSVGTCFGRSLVITPVWLMSYSEFVCSLWG